MDTMLQALLSWQFLLFCLALAAVTFVVRKIAEYVLDNPSVPASKSSKLWQALILPIMPVVLGSVGGYFADKYPYPEGLGMSSGRIVFGLVAGLLSGLVYRVINSFLSSKISIIEESTTRTNTVTEIKTDTVATKMEEIDHVPSVGVQSKPVQAKRTSRKTRIKNK